MPTCSGRLLFIFDGFDEMAARVDQQKMVDNFWSLASVLGPGSKAILTCRTEYFQFAKQAREVLSGNLRGSSMELLFETTRFQVASLAIRVVQNRENRLQAIVISVASLSRAKTFLEEKGLPGSVAEEGLTIDPLKLEGLDTRLVER